MVPTYEECVTAFEEEKKRQEAGEKIVGLLAKHEIAAIFPSNNSPLLTDDYYALEAENKKRGNTVLVLSMA